MAEAFFQVLTENLASLIGSRIGSIMGVDKEINKLSSTLTTIRAVLEDAEDKQFQSKLIQIWLSQLHDMAFEIEDILDECATEISKLKAGKLNLKLKAGKCLFRYKISKLTRKAAGKLNLKKYLFKYKIARRIKEAVEKLDALAEDRHRFHLQETVVRRPNQVVDCRRETVSLLNERDPIYGRDGEKEKIVDILVKEVKDCESLSVLPIIGIGGLGKTTLAQFVYNDDRVTAHFDTKLWVCVSDDFDLEAILKAILESATGVRSDLEKLESLQHRVRQELNLKRYLLILDDVWNENQGDWDGLESILAYGSAGASVVVTTRLKKVADIMGTLPTHCLTMLAEEQCWLLFKLRAFGKENYQHSNLETIGRRIVKKCAGVPLAAKALGGILRFKREEKEWIRVEESHIWNLPEEVGNSILPVLRLSYRHLPFELKRCFAYCAIFPKDYIFDKEKLIFHWMAHGCILSNGKEDAEDVGDQIWNELALRSFFQEVQMERGKTTFKMHDLVHDLAQSILENKTSGIETKHNSVRASDRKIRHVKWSKYPKVSTSSIAIEVSSLTDIMNFNSLRTLKLNGSSLIELPSTIGKLKHLRELDLSHSTIWTLPRTFCCLFNLEILILNGSHIENLPGKIRHMTNLRHILLEGCFMLSHMPYRIGELTCLKTLSRFIVGDKIGYQLDELEHLNLGGRLEIRHLERVQDHTIAKKANLVEKPNLHTLEFYWYCHDTPIELNEKVLEALEPHPNLVTLEVHGFLGRELALWMKNMKNLTQIFLKYCKNCRCLPPFGDLPLLKLLQLETLCELEYIVQIGCQNSLGVKFPSLEHLELSDLPNLKGLFEEEQVGGEMFPNLQRLEIRRCPLLILTSASVCSTLKNLKELECSYSVLPSISSNLENLSSLQLNFDDTSTSIPEVNALKGLCNIKKLIVKNATERRHLPENWSRDLISVTNLEFHDCKMGCIPKGWMRNLTSLEGLVIIWCLGLEDLAEEFKHSHFLKHLSIEFCTEMESLPQGLQQISSLQSLTLNSLWSLTSLPDWLANFASLTHLQIKYCRKIQSLPLSIQGMTNLRYLHISECPQLERRCDKPNGEDWPKIAHIPQLHIVP